MASHCLVLLWLQAAADLHLPRIAKHRAQCTTNGVACLTVHRLLQEMFQEYWRGLQLPDTSHSFRLTLMLFDALDDALDPNEYEDAEAAWLSTR